MSRRRAAASHERESRSRAESPIRDLTNDADPSDGRLVGYRLIRRVASGERADLFLAAAEQPAGAADALPRGAGPAESDPPAGPPLVILRVYRADATDASVALEIEAMSTDATGTLPTLHDVAGLDDGRCVLAVERIGGGSLSRLLADRTVTVGESVTILAPIVVAVAELARRGFVHERLAVTDVLIDDRGRPRLVGLGALRRLPVRLHADRTVLLRRSHTALADLISDVATAVRPEGALDDVVELVRARLGERPFVPFEAEVERRLFELALPEPIAGLDARPRAAARLPARLVDPAAIEEPPEGDPGDAPRAPARGGFVRSILGLAQVPGDIATGFGGGAHANGGGIRDRLFALVAGRRRSLAVGGLIGGAALVLLLTLVPPGTADPTSEAVTGHAAAGSESRTADPSHAGPSDESAAIPTPPEHGAATSAPAAGASTDLDPVAAARGLLERRAECFEALDLSCLDEVVQPGSAAEAHDRAALVAARDGEDAPELEFDLAAIALTTEMGGAVLVSAPRITTEREPASLLMVRGEAGWRLREIFG